MTKAHEHHRVIISIQIDYQSSKADKSLTTRPTRLIHTHTHTRLHSKWEFRIVVEIICQFLFAFMGADINDKINAQFN
jgi:hypothetical protein